MRSRAPFPELPYGDSETVGDPDGGVAGVYRRYGGCLFGWGGGGDDRRDAGLALVGAEEALSLDRGCREEGLGEAVRARAGEGVGDGGAEGAWEDARAPDLAVFRAPRAVLPGVVRGGERVYAVFVCFRSFACEYHIV